MAGDYRLVREQADRIAGRAGRGNRASMSVDAYRAVEMGNHSGKCPVLALTPPARSRSPARLSQVSAMMSS